jgi:hypothetical protein
LIPVVYEEQEQEESKQRFLLEFDNPYICQHVKKGLE